MLMKQNFKLENMKLPLFYFSYSLDIFYPAMVNPIKYGVLTEEFEANVASSLISFSKVLNDASLL